MQDFEIEKTYREICGYISRKMVKTALDHLSLFTVETQSGELRDQLHALENTYQNMLQYTLKGVDDPERKKIYRHLLQSLLKLTDYTREVLLQTYSGWNTYHEKNKFEKGQILTGEKVLEKLEDVNVAVQLDEILEKSKVLNTAKEVFKSPGHSQVLSGIFNHLWLSNTYRDAENNLFETLFDSNRFQWYERCLFVSAVTLSMKDRKSTRLNSSHTDISRMPSSA